MADVSRELPVEGPLDAVMHLASPASPPDYLATAARDAGRGERGDAPGARAGLAPTGRGSVLASTSEVYGDPLVHPQRESYWGNVNPVGPRSVYDEAKRFAEALTMAYHRSTGRRRGHRADLQHLRSSPSARRRPGGVQLPRAGHRGTAAHGVRRRFSDAQPLLRGGRGGRPGGAARLGAHRSGEHRQPRRAHRAGAGGPRARAHRVRRHRSIPAPLPTDDPTRRRPDISLARRELGREPVVPLDEGLRRTAASFAADAETGASTGRGQRG